MQYHAYEFAHAMLSPLRLVSQGLKAQLDFPFNPFRETPMGKNFSAAFDMFDRITRRYGKPEFGIHETDIQGLKVPVSQTTVLRRPFCNLLHFQRDASVAGRRDDPKVLLIAPMSGHYATLLRGTVHAMIAEHDVFITDWVDAREIPVIEGTFDLDDFIEYLIDFVHFIGPNTHIVAVCQPSVPALAATAIMAARNDPLQPDSLTLMGGPIDTRRNPTKVNELAQEQPIDWFRKNVISHVPFPNPGFLRPVYPGFVQLTGFMTMNLERHTTAHVDLFNHLVAGDADSIAAHERFYDEYLSVMDLSAEFYLQTVKTVFQDHALPDGFMMHRDEPVDCSLIRKTALITIEGENDDICGLGQTEAAHDLCTNIAMDEHYHYVQPEVGHYGVFNGRRWRTEIQPRLREMIRAIQFKRRTGNTSKAALPYHTLAGEHDQQFDWRRMTKAGKAQSAKPGQARSAAAKPAAKSRPAAPQPQSKRKSAAPRRKSSSDRTR